MDDPIGNLVEALRRGKVLSDRENLPALRDTDNWSVPSYDFRPVVPELDPYVDQSLVQNNEWLSSLPHKALSLISGKYRLPVVTLISNDDLEAYRADSSGKWQIILSPERLISAAAIAAHLMLMLKNRKFIYEMADDSAARKSVNVGRMKGGRVPLQPIRRVIHLTEVVKIGVTDPQPPQGGIHRSPIPHDRGGHHRTYKSGKTVYFPGPIKVRGGKEAAPPMRYIVKP